MIYAPKPGQRVQCWYAAKSLPHHGKIGSVVAFNPSAKGPKNVMVRLAVQDGQDCAWQDVVVPRGNLRRVP